MIDEETDDGMAMCAHPQQCSSSASAHPSSSSAFTSFILTSTTTHHYQGAKEGRRKEGERPGLSFSSM